MQSRFGAEYETFFCIDLSFDTYKKVYGFQMTVRPQLVIRTNIKFNDKLINWWLNLLRKNTHDEIGIKLLSNQDERKEIEWLSQ